MSCLEWRQVDGAGLHVTCQIRKSLIDLSLAYALEDTIMPVAAIRARLQKRVGCEVGVYSAAR